MYVKYPSGKFSTLSVLAQIILSMSNFFSLSKPLPKEIHHPIRGILQSCAIESVDHHSIVLTWSSSGKEQFTID